MTMSCVLVDFDSKAMWIINHDSSINTWTYIKYIGTELVAYDCLPCWNCERKDYKNSLFTVCHSCLVCKSYLRRLSGLDVLKCHNITVTVITCITSTYCIFDFCEDKACLHNLHCK